jgi:DNA-binding IclR family transcriptional regulator
VEISESVHLAIASNTGAVVVEQVMSEGPSAVNARIGHHEPLHCSSVGKCLLTFSNFAGDNELLKCVVYDKYTDKTITDEASLLTEIDKIRKNGYAVDNGELNTDIRCVAVPVFNNLGTCIYAIGVSGTAANMTEKRIEKIVPCLLRASRDMAMRG